MRNSVFMIFVFFLFQACSSLKQVEETDYIELNGVTHVPQSIFDPDTENVPVTADLPSPSPQEEDKFQIYTVKPDDNLGYIALQLLGDRNEWKTLQKWNPELLARPEKIFQGMEIKYQLRAKVTYHTYIVQKNDNLEKISQKLFQDKSKWRLLQQWNRELKNSPNLIVTGMELKYIRTDTAPRP